ncbi:hypothetical protein [Seonamhaeicola sp.]|uniref:energy transducer TonB n=1 Tax=Seonamhaeicola sp. TaxID=1912245 RepID=UPI00261C75AF|nr:hypothetical protein [Seonamhaeicola sp.]
MKKQRTVTMLTLAIATVGFIALGFSKKNTEIKAEKTAISKANFNATTINTNFFPALIEKNKIADEKDKLDLFYMVKGKYSRSISDGKLKSPQSIDDIVPDYPSSWIASYNWVEITTKRNNEVYTASGKSGTLTDEQKDLLKNVPIDNAVNVTLKYKSKNSISEKYAERQMKVSFTVVPETEAEFIGSYDDMISYLKENSLKKIEAANIKEFKPVSIIFYVDENGQTEDLELTNSFGNDEINELLMKAIKDMPAWKPAIDSSGKKVKQKFELIVGPDMC